MSAHALWPTWQGWHTPIRLAIRDAGDYVGRHRTDDETQGSTSTSGESK